jgi:hypothetical protein
MARPAGRIDWQPADLQMCPANATALLQRQNDTTESQWIFIMLFISHKQLTGNPGEPGIYMQNKTMNNFIHNVYMMRYYRSTEYQMHIYPFLLLLLLSFCFLNFPPLAPFLNVPANLWRTRQRCARTRQPLADPQTMRTDPPVKCIILPVCTSFRIPRQTLTREPPPPPPLRLRWDGEGGGGLAHQSIPKQVLYFTAPFTNGLHMHMLYTYTTYTILNTGWKNHLKKCSQIYCI